MYAITGHAIFSSFRSIPDSRRHVSPRFRCCSIVSNVDTLKFNNQSTAATGSVGKGGGGDEEKIRVSGIHVPREKYISVRKGELLDGIVSSLFESKEEADEFKRFSRYLDSILQAEHKVLLEELRLNYSLAHLPDEKGNNYQEAASKGLELTWKMGINGHALGKDVGKLEYDKTNEMYLPGEYADSGSADFGSTSRLDNAANFQRTFMKLLQDAKFEEISANDLMLARTLETDYLLTLPIYVDWKKALESNAIIFRRGYSTERQNGLLIVEKLDYLQSKLLQEIFFLLSKTLNGIIRLINKAIKHSKEEDGTNVLFQRVKIWLMEQSFPETMHPYSEERYNCQLDNIKVADKALPIWLAAQRAGPLYEGLLSSIGPRGRLMRRLLSWIGLIPSTPETLFELNKESKLSEAYPRPNFLPRVTISDIWRPATEEYCGNFWDMFKAGVSILFTKSFIQEPAFHELILLYTDDTSQRESLSKTEALPLHLKIYEGIPIPDLPVIFPNRKLSFRILDTIRLDIASILGLLAYFLNYKFETINSSPSAFLLDVVAISALILYASRVILGYKTTWDRYQLLVNKTLYEKTLASGFGSVHFLLDASEQQQYKEAILAYALLLHPEKYQNQTCRESVKDACERFIFDKFTEKVEMPVGSALETLQRLRIVNEVSHKETPELEALPCSRACDLLKEQWNELLEKKVSTGNNVFHRGVSRLDSQRQRSTRRQGQEHLLAETN